MTTTFKDATVQDQTQRGNMRPLAAMAEAKRLSGQYGIPSFVYQNGPESFTYCFVKENPACGVLVARFSPTGKSF